MYKFGNLGLIPTLEDDKSTIKSETDSMRSILRAFCDDKSEPSKQTSLSECTCDEQTLSQLSEPEY